jgi:hypothetical protein
MPIVQINLFICEDCGVRVAKIPELEVRLQEDPIVNLAGWHYREDDDKLCCPACLTRGMPETEDPGANPANLKLHVDRLHELLSSPEYGLSCFADAMGREMEAIRILTGGLRPPVSTLHMAWDDPRLAGLTFAEYAARLKPPAETPDPVGASAALKVHVARLHELLSAQQPAWYVDDIKREIEAVQILTGPRVVTEPLQRPKGDG